MSISGFATRLVSVNGIGLSGSGVADPDLGYVRVIWHDSRSGLQLTADSREFKTGSPSLITVNSITFQGVCSELKMTEPSSWYPLFAVGLTEPDGPCILVAKYFDAPEEEYELLDDGPGEPASIIFKLYPEDEKALLNFGVPFYARHNSNG